MSVPSHTYQTTVGCSFLYPSNTQPLPFWGFFASIYQTSSRSLSLSLCLPVCLLISLGGIQAPKLLSLWPITSQVTSSLSLTFTVRAALGKCWWTDLLMQGMVELQGGQQGLALLHYPTSYRPIFWGSGDLVIGCSGSEAQCQRTCGRHVEI